MNGRAETRWVADTVSVERIEDMQQPAESTLYRDLVDAGCDTDHHESDLYVVVTPESTAIITRYKGEQDMPTTFISQTDGRRNYDIAFGYEPFWEEKQRRAAR